MGFWSRIHDFLVGAAGPADIVVTRDGAGVRLRLPNQRYPREPANFVLLLTLVIGVFIIASSIEAVLSAAGEWRERVGPCIAIGVALAVLVSIAGIWRVVWHYEFVLTSRSLQVEWITTYMRTRSAAVDLEPILQLTILRVNKNCTLQAEAATGRPRPFFKSQDLERMQQLATLLAEHHAVLTPGRAPLRVAVEEPHRATDADRAEPPLDSQVALTQPGSGVTLDFPLPEDDRLRTRRNVWLAFEIGILLLVSAVIWFAACHMADWPSLLKVAYIMFAAGICVLIAAANDSRFAWFQNHQDDDLRQLSVVGNMLIRTARDHRKQAWYRAEICTIRAEVVVTYPDSESSSPVTHYLYLVLELQNGEKVKLLGKSYEPSADYRPKAEFEWVATRLRHALLEDGGEPTVPSGDASSQAIKEMQAWIKETRIL